MFFRSPMLALGFAAALSGGCEKVRAVVCEPAKAAAGGGAAGATAAAKGSAAGAPAPAPSEPPAAPAEPKHEDSEARAPEVLTSTAKFALPFAWEKSPAEPLARAKLFLREIADDNDAYMKKGPEFFKSFAAGETPRATILSCADSRVQAGALDATPENDDYTIRNLGNQLESDLGSVQYGIEELHTPVLLVLGHTGCTAVKAALGDASQVSEPIRKELSGIRVKKTKGGSEEKRWAAAVLENVHDQVRAALKQFAPRVNTGELTIVGAVYDFRNDMGRGPGRLTVVNVNGNQDEERLKAFGDAIMSTPNPNGRGGGARESALDRLAKVLAEHGTVGAEEDDEDDEEAPMPSPPAGKTKPARLAH